MPVFMVTNSVAMATVLLTLKGAKPGGLSRSPLFGAHPMGVYILEISYRFPVSRFFFMPGIFILGARFAA